MPRPKGSKNKPKEGKTVVKSKPVVKTLGSKDAPVTKKVVEEAAKAHGATTGPLTAKKTKDGGVVMAATRDDGDGKKRYDVVMRGGQAVKVESTDEPDLD